MSLTLRYAAGSDVGLRRDGNEDSAYAGPRVLAVADGVGGAVAGEVASSVAIAHLAELDDDAPGADLLAALRAKATAANAELRALVESNAALEGMSTTLTALLWDGGRLGLAHVGDSRGYLYRDGELHRITRDHTLVQSMVDEGRISEEEATVHPQRSLILRALDGRSEPDLDLTMREARQGDRYLLCSDGLSDVVSEATLRETLAQADPQQAIERLIDLALRGGGPDNITAVVGVVVDGPLPDPAPVVVGAAATRTPERRAVADSAAGRAALATGTTTTATSAPAPESPRQQRHWRRPLVLVLAAAALMAFLCAGGWAYIQAQYYVGADDGQVVIFRGVGGSIAGLSLHSVHTRTDLAVADLPAFEQPRVDDGINADGRHDAGRIVDSLRAEACDLRPAPKPTAPPKSRRTRPAVVPTPQPTTRVVTGAAGPFTCPAGTP
jgi:protein phosphatase